MALSPETIGAILRIKRQQDQDAADRAAEAAKNAPQDTPRAPGPFGPLAGATSDLISGGNRSQGDFVQSEGNVGLPFTAQPPRLQDHTGRQFLQSPREPLPQIDSSNLAGQVSTDLTPLPASKRIVAGAPVDTSPLTSAEINYYNPHQHSQTMTDEGTPLPMHPTYRASTDSLGRHIGKGARFGAGFREGLRGGPIFGLGNAIASLLIPGHGNEEKYNMDTEAFNAEQHADLARERADPLLQNQLQSQQNRMDLPVKQQLISWQQQQELNRQAQLEDIKAANKKDQINLTAKNALTAIGKKFENTKFLQTQAAKDKASLEVRQIAAGYVGNPQFDAMTDKEKEAFISDRWNEQRQQKLDESVARESKNEEQALLAKERRENPEKFRAPGKGPGGITANYQMRLKLKPIEDEQRANQAALNVWNKKLATGEITEDEFKQKTEGLNKEKEMLKAKWEMKAAEGAGVGSAQSGTQHPKVGKAFTNPDDGKQYIADEIDSDGNITKYHPKP